MGFDPKEIILETASKLNIVWDDGLKSEFDAFTLRCSCPCAECVNEWTGEKMLKDEQIEKDVKIEDVSVVGRYALNFRFSDGHEAGIYSFKYLRELSGSKECL